MKRFFGPFSGAGRSVFAIAMTTLREEIRSRSFLVYLFLFLLFVGVYRVGPGGGPEAEPAIGVARFLDYAYSGMSVLLLLAGVFTAVASKRADAEGIGIHREVQRLAGAAAWFWGRLLGILFFLVALGLVFGTITLVHYMARFGDAKGVVMPIRSIVSSDGFESARRPVFIRKVGDESRFDFDVPRGSDQVIEGRFAPKLSVMTEGGATRSSFPVALRVVDPDRPSLDKSFIVRIRHGKPKRWFVELEGRPRPERLQVFVRKIDPEYLIRIHRDDLQIYGSTRSFFAGLLEGALMAALFAAVLAAFTQLAAWYFSWGVSLLTALGLLVIASSYGVLEIGLFRHFDPTLRLALLETMQTILPDFGEYDAATRLSRGEAIAFGKLGALSLRVLATAVAGGLLIGIFDTQSGGRR